MDKIEHTEVEKVLNDFVNYVVKESKKNAPKASGDLKKSIKKGKIKENPNSISASILAEDYLPFIDQGVSGVITKHNTPFSYKRKGGGNSLKGMPPPNILTTYGKRKSGKFLARDRKQVGFMIARSIFLHGIKPTKFFTTPFEQAYKQLPDDIVEAYGLDIESFLEFTLKE